MFYLKRSSTNKCAIVATCAKCAAVIIHSCF